MPNRNSKAWIMLIHSNFYCKEKNPSDSRRIRQQAPGELFSVQANEWKWKKPFLSSPDDSTLLGLGLTLGAMILIAFWKATDMIGSSLGGNHHCRIMCLGERRKSLLKYYFELSRTSLACHTRGSPDQFLVTGNLLEGHCMSKRWKKTMLI